MKILLHIGQSKTGTSAIQDFLTINRKALQQAGVFYPAVRKFGMPIEIVNHNAVADALVNLSRYPHIDAKDYFDQFFSEATQLNAELMILSAEHFFGGEPRIWETSGSEEYFKLYQEKISKLAKFLSGHDVTIIVYLRPQLDWLVSAIGQTVRVQKLISNPEIYQSDKQFYELIKPLLMYSKLLEIWYKTINPVKFIVVPYIRESLYKNSSISDFLHRTGLDHIHFPHANSDIQVNKSLTREYLEVKKLLNRNPRTKTSERVIIHILEKLSEESTLGFDYCLDPEIAHDVELLCEQDNKRLNTLFKVEGSAFEYKGEAMRFGTAIEKGQVAAAMLRLEKEYRSPGGRILWLNFAVKALLRNYCRPLHVLLHQVKIAYIKYKYKS